MQKESEKARSPQAQRLIDRAVEATERRNREGLSSGTLLYRHRQALKEGRLQTVVDGIDAQIRSATWKAVAGVALIVLLVIAESVIGIESGFLDGLGWSMILYGPFLCWAVYAYGKQVQDLTEARTLLRLAHEVKGDDAEASAEPARPSKDPERELVGTHA